jgi:hypothetical protein
MSFPPQVPYARAVTVALFLAALVGTAATVSAQGVPGTDANKCLAGKTKCVNKKIAGLLKCRAKCQGNPAACGQPETDCEAKVMAKFDGGPDPTKGCFAKLEAKADPSKPESVCLTTGDSGTIETQVDLLVGVLLANLARGQQRVDFAGSWELWARIATRHAPPRVAHTMISERGHLPGRRAPTQTVRT